MDLYFKRHDGQAVTCDDFLAAMADANGQDLSKVARWSVFPPLLVTHSAHCMFPAGTSTLLLHASKLSTILVRASQPVLHASHRSMLPVFVVSRCSTYAGNSCSKLWQTGASVDTPY